MKKYSLLIFAFMATILLTDCRKSKNDILPTPVTECEVATPPSVTAARAVYTGFPETFEAGSKGAYAAANVTLATGSWNLDNALIGTSTSDRKNGTKSVRIQNTGKLTMNFDATEGAYEVNILHAKYGSDAASTWTLWYSTNGGSTWTQTGGTITTSTTTLATATFAMNINGTVRFQLRKASGGRLNIDDFSITDNVPVDTTPTQDDNMAMGNPSGATTSTSNTNNYLMVKSQFALSYNNSRGTANWVSWHLSAAWKGGATRCDCFTQDGTLPTGYYKASTSNYTNTGFDRGHMCPSDDRDLNSTDNSITFKMTNIMPQAPQLNQITWGNLEAYCRSLLAQGNELYVIAGAYGQGGTGSNGGSTSTIASGNIKVPARYWKVIVVLPNGSNDVTRVGTTTRVIAVDMPNVQTVSSQPWGWYRTSVDAIEAATGYDLLSSVSGAVQSTIEASVDAGPTN